MTGESTARCRHCGRAFATSDRRLLHVGLEHPDRMNDDRRRAYEQLREAERAAVRRYKLRALFALVLAYFGFLFAYAVFAFG